MLIHSLSDSPLGSSRSAFHEAARLAVQAFGIFGRSGARPNLRPEFWIKQNLNLRGWNSQVHGELPRISESTKLCLEILSMQTGRRDGRLAGEAAGQAGHPGSACGAGGAVAGARVARVARVARAARAARGAREARAARGARGARAARAARKPGSPTARCSSPPRSPR